MPIPKLDRATAMPFRWHDWMLLQDTPAFACTPADRHELVALLGTIEDLRALRIRAVGSGHSSSDVGAPRANAFAVSFGRFHLDHEEIAAGWWRADWRARAPGALRPDATLCRVHGGTKIADVNARLGSESPPRALLNLGSYDQQTIAGVIATATHGSGLASGPMSDFVASIELVAIVADAKGDPVVRSYRIEPANGATDRAKFEAAAAIHGMELLQDDAVFYSAVVGLGCFGIVTAVTLQVVPAFSLEETRDAQPWSAVRPILMAESAADYFDLTMTAMPVLLGGPNEHRCLLTRRKAVAPSPHDATKRHDARVEELEKRVKQHPPRASLTGNLATMGSDNPRTANYCAWEHGIEGEAKLHPPGNPFRAPSAVVFRTSIGDYVYATSIEVVVPRSATLVAVETAMAHSRAMHESGYHHLSPYGIRFVCASRHYLAPEHQQESCTIEAPILIGARKRLHSIDTSPAAIETMLRAFYDRFEEAKIPARFHWGQRNFVTRASVRRVYPMFEKAWMPQYERFNRFGNFDNAFTDRLGISRG